MIRRTFWKCDTLDKTLTDTQGGNFEERFRETARYEVAREDEANLIGSRLKKGLLGIGPDLHAPVLDIDLPCKLVESSTPGHFHLFIDKAITWEQYEAILRALGAAGIIEPGYESASIRRKQTFVRKPGVVKPSVRPGAEPPPNSSGWHV